MIAIELNDDLLRNVDYDRFVNVINNAIEVLGSNKIECDGFYRNNSNEINCIFDSNEILIRLFTESVNNKNEFNLILMSCIELRYLLNEIKVDFLH